MAMEGTDICLLPSLGWSPSKDTDARQEAAYEIMTKALDDRQRAKEMSNHRDSLSDFEFAAISAVQNESFHGEHMLAAADELFFKGKLLPLYNPDYEDRYAVHGTQDCMDRHVFLNQPPLNCSLYRADSDNLQADMADLTVAISPKAPKCSVMLKEFFGWKKMAKSICACAAPEEVAAGSLCRSGKKTKKKKAAKVKQKTPLMLPASAPSSSLCLASSRHLPRRTTDADSMAMSPARNSVSEPLLTCSLAQLGYSSVSSDENHRYQSFHESLSTQKPLHDQSKVGINGSCLQEQPQRGSRPNISPSMRAQWGKPASGRRSCDGKQRSEEDGCDGRSADPIESNASVQMLLCKPNPHRMWGSLSSHEGSRSSDLHGEADMVSRRSPRALLAGLGGTPCLQYGDTACAALVTEQASKLGSTGRWRRQTNKGEASPEKSFSSSYGAPTASASLGRHAAMEMESETQRSSELTQSRSSESSSSSSGSARSQQQQQQMMMRKYEQWKVVRQRDSGWRILERSSSYNSGMAQSMRVAPVLNVPVIVCMSRSKSSNHVMHTLRRA